LKEAISDKYNFQGAKKHKKISEFKIFKGKKK